jgi:hypothetical protein
VNFVQLGEQVKVAEASDVRAQCQAAVCAPCRRVSVFSSGQKHGRCRLALAFWRFSASCTSDTRFVLTLHCSFASACVACAQGCAWFSDCQLREAARTVALPHVATSARAARKASVFYSKFCIGGRVIVYERNVFGCDSASPTCTHTNTHAHTRSRLTFFSLPSLSCPTPNRRCPSSLFVCRIGGAAAVVEDLEPRHVQASHCLHGGE